MQTTNPSLVLSYDDDILNASLDCETLGIRYQVFTAPGDLAGLEKTTQIRRKDNQSGRYSLVAQWERSTVGSDLFKFTEAESTTSRTVPVSSYLTETNGDSTE